VAVVIVGIDPGISGALAWFDQVTGTLFDVVDLPTVLANKVGNKQVISDAGLVAELEKYHDPSKLIVVIEKQVAGTGNIQGRKPSASSMLMQGRGFGIIEGVTAALKCERHFVMPQVWKRAMGLNTDKEYSRARALQLWPQHADKFKFKKNEGRAEAALLALWYFQKEYLPTTDAIEEFNREDYLTSSASDHMEGLL
jgi:crossover junction endodeoxyribonuclease RuvC